MSEWKEVKLLNANIMLIDGDRGINYPKEKDFSSSGYCLFLNAKNVTKNGFKFDECMFIDENKEKSLGGGKLNRNDIIITTRGTVGNIALYDESIKQSHIRINSGMAILRNLNTELDNQYLKFLLVSDNFLQQINRVVFGSAQPQLTIKTINSFIICFPVSLAEQQKIAKILATVDAVIEKTEAAITKYKAIKKGMLHDLFTRGIADNGQLRPAYEDAPERYKQTVLGWIPKEWDVDILANILEDNNCPSGIYKEKSLYGNGMNILKISEVFKYDIYKGEQIQRVPINNHEYGLNKIIQGDILIAIASVKLEGVGKAMFVEKISEPTCFDHNVALLRINEFNNSLFLFYFLKSETIRKTISQNCTQVGTIFLKSSSIKNFKILIIPLIEQIEIGKRLKTIDSKIQTEQNTLNKYQKLKQGLMQDLLTGKVTVSV